jgi:hypothetical protein
MRGREKKCIQSFGEKDTSKRIHTETEKILNRIFKKKIGWVWIGFIWLWIGMSASIL